VGQPHIRLEIVAVNAFALKEMAPGLLVACWLSHCPITRADKAAQAVERYISILTAVAGTCAVSSDSATGALHPTFAPP
jgi:hypothetical protein